MGWYGDHKRQHLEEAGMDCIGDEVRKRQKSNATLNESGKEAISLGSLSLVHYEDFKRKVKLSLQLSGNN